MKTTFLPFSCIMIISILMATHLLFRSHDFPFAPDSAAYIEEARNLIQEDSALVTPYGPYGVDKSPDKLFPIGFPVVLAFISMFGLDPRDAALVVGRLSAILLPLLLYFSFRKQIGASRAAILAGLSTLSPGVLTNAPIGASDVFALAIAVSAIGLALNARSPALLFVSGAVSGFAYAVRNANIALLVALTIYFLYLWVNSPTQRVKTTKYFIAFLAGVSLVILPLFLRNIMVFGALNPYIMEPSTVGAVENIRMYIVEFIYDITALRSLGNYIGWSIPGLTLFLALLLGVSQLLMHTWGHLTENVKNTIFLCSTYSIIGACVVIAARSRYEWGELINIRHTMQYTPFFLAAFLAAIPSASVSVPLFRVRIGGLVLVFVISLFHVFYTFKPGEFERDTRSSFYALSGYQQGKDHLCAPEENILIVSNWEYIFRIMCNTGVRHVDIHNSPKSSFFAATQSSNAIVNTLYDLSNKFKERPIRAGFFLNRSGVGTENILLNKVDVENLQKVGWKIVRSDEKGLLLSHE